MIYDSNLGDLPETQVAPLFERVVIVHAEMGVYLGSFIGLGIWSKLDPAYQEEAVTFESEEAAKKYIETWKPIDDEEQISVETYSFPSVTCAEDRYATLQELAAAGVETWDPKA